MRLGQTRVLVLVLVLVRVRVRVRARARNGRCVLHAARVGMLVVKVGRELLAPRRP